MILIADPNRVYDSTETPGFALGQLAFDHEGCAYMFLKADATVDEAETVIIDSDGTAAPITATLCAAGTGTGKMVAVSPGSDRSQAIASGDFFWGCRLAPGTAGKKAVIDSAAGAFTQLYGGATAGALTDTVDLDAKVVGIVCDTTAGSPDEQETVIINWPFVAIDSDASST